MTINCRGTLVDLSTPKVMGILNLTPDSFYDGGQYKTINRVTKQVETMINEGATFVDIGAYSSRPNADFVSETEEADRLFPILEKLINTFPDLLISVDTFRSKIAKQSVSMGAAIVNDISAGHLDANMLKTVAQLQVPYIMMHMRGTPQTMQSLTDYNSILEAVLLYFSERLNAAKNLGINDVIVDPGFGFSKTLEQNFELLNQLEYFKILERPILTGISRKSMIYKTLNTTASNALNGTTALHMVALQKQTNILRVHDVKQAVECIKLNQALNT